MTINHKTDEVEAREGAKSRNVSLMTMVARPKQRQAALAVVILSALAFVIAIPFARVPLATLPAFIPSYESALAINDLITAVFLFGQFSRTRSRAFLALASGYLFNALIIIPHALTFPGVFSPTGLLGAGQQTTAWLYIFWHGGFPLFVLAYALLASRSIDDLRENARIAAGAAITFVVASVCALTMLATIGHDLLPVIIQDSDFSRMTTTGASPVVWCFTAVALIALWRRRAAVLDLWLLVVLWAWLLDVALSAIFGSSRYDLGWYAGRSYGLLAASFVLIVLLDETNELHGRLLRAKGQLEGHARVLAKRVQERTAQLARSNETLKAEIAERKQAEAQLVQAQKMEAIGNLTGGMAHDFNNLLGVIIGNLDLLQDLVKSSPEANELATEALDAALRGAELTRRLLAFSRRQSLQPVLININELVDGITKLLSRTLGEEIEIVVDLAPEPWPVVADPAQLEAALTNLATNARDAMPRGGRLRITTGNRQLDEDYASHHPEVVPGDFAMIEVTDTGMGIPAEVMSRVFEPFFTTKEPGKGTGLGLSMVFGFIKQSGGHINVYSEPSLGTTFRLYLPRSEAAAVSERKRIDDEITLGRGETVLVVEDNAKLRRIVTRQLRELSYRVIEANNAAAALAILEQEPVDILFTDVVMPGEMNGVELARAALSRWGQLGLVLTSGFPAKINSTLEAAEAAHLLSKPYRKADLARAMRDALREARAAGSPLKNHAEAEVP